jgi:hypothetical protein
MSHSNRRVLHVQCHGNTTTTASLGWFVVNSDTWQISELTKRVFRDLHSSIYNRILIQIWHSISTLVASILITRDPSMKSILISGAVFATVALANAQNCPIPQQEFDSYDFSNSLDTCGTYICQT